MMATRRVSGCAFALAAQLHALASAAEVAKVTHSGSDYTLTNVRVPPRVVPAVRWCLWR